MKKQKLLNKEDYIFFIDITSIKVSPDINKNNQQEHDIGRLKGALAAKLYLCSCTVVFCLCLGNSHDVSERRKLIESIYSKNNNYLLMDKAYEKDHGFNIVIPFKKNCKLPWSYDK